MNQLEKSFQKLEAMENSETSDVKGGIVAVKLLNEKGEDKGGHHTGNSNNKGFNCGGNFICL